MKAFLMPAKAGLLWGLCLFFLRCGDPEDPVTPVKEYKVAEAIKGIFPDKDLALLEGAGMPIFEGESPPEIQDFFSTNKMTGVVFQVDHQCIFDLKNRANIGKNYDTFTDTILIARDGTPEQRAYVSYHSPADKGSGFGFASGSGDNFTIFFKVEEGEVNQVSYQARWVISGTLVRGSNNNIIGISNLHDAFWMEHKGPDPGDKAANPGVVRVFKDPDGFSRAGP